MKYVKIMIPYIVAFMIVFFSDSASAQTDLEYHAQLSTLNKTMILHTNAIASGEAKTRNDLVIHYNEFRKSLAEAKKTHNLLKKIIPPKAMSDAIIHHDNIDKYFASATAQANSMLEELKNEKPDDAKMKELAKKIHDEIQMVEKERQTIIKVTH